MDIVSGSIVLSKAGRDRERLFVVLSIDDNFALIADGKIRRVEKPKKKKLRHLEFAGICEGRIYDEILDGKVPTNREIRNLLVKLDQSTQGG